MFNQKASLNDVLQKSLLGPAQFYNFPFHGENTNTKVVEYQSPTKYRSVTKIHPTKEKGDIDFDLLDGKFSNEIALCVKWTAFPSKENTRDEAYVAYYTRLFHLVNMTSGTPPPPPFF